MEPPFNTTLSHRKPSASDGLNGEKPKGSPARKNLSLNVNPASIPAEPVLVDLRDEDAHDDHDVDGVRPFNRSEEACGERVASVIGAMDQTFPSRTVGRPQVGAVRPRFTSVSLAYYGDSVDVGASPPSFERPRCDTDEGKGYHFKQSRRLPGWVWFILAKSLGIKLHERDKPWFATLLHVLTLIFAFGYGITNTWYQFYNILSKYTKQTVLIGSVYIIIGLFWCSLGTYSNQLAAKLFSNQKFVDSVRMHTKTVFKISSAGLLFLLSAVGILLNDYHTAGQFDKEYCQNVDLSGWVCHVMFISKVGFSIFTLIWNVLVGIVVLSVCRTHTIGIRRLIRELDEDARLYEYRRKQTLLQGPFSDRIEPSILELTDDEEYVWEDDVSLSSDDLPAQYPNPRPGGVPRNSTVQGSPPHTPLKRLSNHGPVEDNIQLGSVPRCSTGLDRPTIRITREDTCASSSVHSATTDGASIEPTSESQNLIQPDPPSQVSSRGSRSQVESPMQSTRVEMGSPMRVAGTQSQGTASIDDNLSMGPHMLSTEDILLRYWRISTRLRASSQSLQRWLATWIMFIMVWSIMYLVFWIKNKATLYGIAEFLIPLLLLPLMCSAYGEVNNEGRRMLKCICPTEDRVYMLLYLTDNPLQMTVFGFPVNYSTILTVIAALGVAFTSRIILDELQV